MQAQPKHTKNRTTYATHSVYNKIQELHSDNLGKFLCLRYQEFSWQLKKAEVRNSIASLALAISFFMLAP